MPRAEIPEASRAEMHAWRIGGTNAIPGWRSGRRSPASGRHVALANNRNVLTSPPFTVKKGETIRVTLKARE